MTDDKWGQLRQRLLKTVGQNNFTTWIEPLELDQVNAGVATFHVPTNFMGNYVSQNFADLILHEFNMSGEPVQRLAFKVAANSPTRPVQPTAAEALEAPAVAQAYGAGAQQAEGMGFVKSPLEELQAAPLDPRFTFDSFVVGKPNEDGAKVTVLMETPSLNSLEY